MQARSQTQALVQARSQAQAQRQAHVIQPPQLSLDTPGPSPLEDAFEISYAPGTSSSMPARSREILTYVEDGIGAHVRVYGEYSVTVHAHHKKSTLLPAFVATYNSNASRARMCSYGQNYQCESVLVPLTSECCNVLSELVNAAWGQCESRLCVCEWATFLCFRGSAYSAGLRALENLRDAATGLLCVANMCKQVLSVSTPNGGTHENVTAGAGDVLLFTKHVALSVVAPFVPGNREPLCLYALVQMRKVPRDELPLAGPVPDTDNARLAAARILVLLNDIVALVNSLVSVDIARMLTAAAKFEEHEAGIAVMMRTLSSKHETLLHCLRDNAAFMNDVLLNSNFRALDEAYFLSLMHMSEVLCDVATYAATVRRAVSARSHAHECASACLERLRAGIAAATLLLECARNSAVDCMRCLHVPVRDRVWSLASAQHFSSQMHDAGMRAEAVAELATAKNRADIMLDAMHSLMRHMSALRSVLDCHGNNGSGSAHASLLSSARAVRAMAEITLTSLETMPYVLASVQN